MLPLASGLRCTPDMPGEYVISWVTRFGLDSILSLTNHPHRPSSLLEPVYFFCECLAKLFGSAETLINLWRRRASRPTNVSAREPLYASLLQYYVEICVKNLHRNVWVRQFVNKNSVTTKLSVGLSSFSLLCLPILCKVPLKSFRLVLLRVSLALSSSFWNSVCSLWCDFFAILTTCLEHQP